MKNLIKFIVLFLFATAQSLLAQTPGSLDITFSNGGVTTASLDSVPNNTRGAGIALQTDGKIVSIANYNHGLGDAYAGIIRHNSNGKVDSSFGINGIVKTTFPLNYNNSLKSVAVQNDGKIVIAGYSQITSASLKQFLVLRYNSNGSVDASFGTNGRTLIDIAAKDDIANTLAIQADGKIVVGGYCTQNNSFYDFAVVRLNTNGSIDNTFGTNGITVIDFESDDDVINSLLIQPDGYILAAGYYRTSVVPHRAFGMIRLNEYGALDGGFGTGGILKLDISTTSHEISAMALQEDSSAIIAGNGSNDIYAMRIKPNGTVDGTFGNSGIYRVNSTTTYALVINALAIQPDGKIYLAGNKKNTNVTPNNDFYLARLKTDGTLDNMNLFGNAGEVVTDFYNNDDAISRILIQPDGKLVAMGTSYTTGGIDLALARYHTGIREAVKLVSPANNSSNVALPVALSWTVAPGVNTYQIQVSTTADFSTLVIDSMNSNLTISVVLNQNTTYYWRVRTTNGTLTSDLSFWSPVWTFKTTAPTTMPTLISPANNTTNITLTPAFDWSDAANAAAYELQVATSNTFATPILSQTALTTSNYTTATALANNTIYYWRVRAKNSLGNSTWSTVWSFTTVPVVPPMPSVPTLLLPANNATNVVASPVFDWSDATATNTYHIQVSTSNTFANMVVNDSSTTLSTFTPSLALILNTTYFWRVRAKGTGGTSAWSSVWSFKTENPNSVEENKATSFKIYPNPFTDFIQVEKENESGTIVLFDMQGRKILEQETAIATKLNTENLDAGSYIIMLQTNTGNVSKQIIKTK